MIGKESIIVKPGHRMVRQEVNKKSIKDFYLLLDERREIRWGKVKSMAINLEKKIHFESPIVINDNGNGRRIIDGNHRIEAIKMFLEKVPDGKVFINIAKYSNMTREKEREKYTYWNKGTPESATDYLMNYYKTIPYGEQILRELPVTLKKSGKELPIVLLIGSYVNARKQRFFEGGYGKGGEKTVEDFRTIKPSDIKIMKEFIRDMKEIFGEPIKKSKYWRSSVVPAFFRIWYDNLDITPTKLNSAFKHIYNNWEAQWEVNAKKGGKTACIYFYRDLILVLQTQRKACKIKSDRDIIKSKIKKSEL